MKLLLDSFWRAVAYCLHPRVIGLSLAPLLIATGIAFGLSWFYWEDAVAGVRQTLENWDLLDALLKWVTAVTGEAFRAVLAPLIVVAVALPVIVLLSMLLVAMAMMPAIVSLVAERRFPTLERKRGAGFLSSVMWSVGCTVLALALIVLSMPLWLIPPLVLLLPPLIWGWLTTQMMSFDALAEHASAAERRAVRREHRWPLLGMGVICGYLGAAPSAIWAFGAVTFVLAPLLIAISIWLYTLVFAFAALWFAHYALAALDALRRRTAIEVVMPPPTPAVPPPPALERRLPPDVEMPR